MLYHWYRPYSSGLFLVPSESQQEDGRRNVLSYGCVYRKSRTNAKRSSRRDEIKKREPQKLFRRDRNRRAMGPLISDREPQVCPSCWRWYIVTQLLTACPPFVRPRLVLGLLLLSGRTRDAGVRGGHALGPGTWGVGRARPRSTERAAQRERGREARRTHWTGHLGRYSLIPEFMRRLLGGDKRRGPHIGQGDW